MTQILHIIWFKILAFMKPEMDFSARGLVKSVGSTLVYGGFAAGAYIFAIRAHDFLLIEQRIGLFLLHRFISIILFIFFLSVNVGNIVVSYSTLFRSPEVAFLLTKPVNPIRIFVIKFFDNFFYSSGTLIMVMVALLTGFTLYFKVNVLHAVFLFLFNFLPFMLSAGLLGVLLLLVLINTALKFGFKRVVAVLGLGYIGIIVLFFQVSSPIDTVAGVMKFFPNVDGYFASLIPPYIRFLPSNWLAEAMFWTVKGDISAAFPYYVLQVSLSFFLLIVVTLIGKATFLDTWHKSIDFRENRETKVSKPPIFAFRNTSFLKNAFSEVIYKREFHLFLREPAQVIHFSVLLFLIIIFVASLSGISMLASNRFLLLTTIFMAVYLFNVFFIVTLALRYVFPLISLEGNVVWKVKSAPVSTRKLLRKRLMIPLTIILILSQVMSLFIVWRFSPSLLLPMAIISFSSSWFLVMMSFGMGGLFINLKEKNPVRLSSSQGASISFLFSMIYLVLLIAALYVPLSQFFNNFLRNRIIDASALYTTSLLVFLVSMAVGWFFYRIGIKSLEKDV